jgi:hypothetical protein
VFAGRVFNTLYERPIQSLLGVAIVTLGVRIFDGIGHASALSRSQCP